MKDSEFILNFIKSNEDKFIDSKLVTLQLGEVSGSDSHYEIHFKEGALSVMHFSSKEDLASVKDIVQRFCDEIGVELIVEK